MYCCLLWRPYSKHWCKIRRERCWRSVEYSPEFLLWSRREWRCCGKIQFLFPFVPLFYFLSELYVSFFLSLPFLFFSPYFFFLLFSLFLCFPSFFLIYFDFFPPFICLFLLFFLFNFSLPLFFSLNYLSPFVIYYSVPIISLFPF